VGNWLASGGIGRGGKIRPGGAPPVRRNRRKSIRLPHADSPPLPTPDDREARVQALLDRLRPQAEKALRRMAEAVVEAPDARLFGDLEFALRGQAHDSAAAAHRAGLRGRKKGGITAPASPAPAAADPPSSSAT